MDDTKNNVDRFRSLQNQSQKLKETISKLHGKQEEMKSREQEIISSMLSLGLVEKSTKRDDVLKSAFERINRQEKDLTASIERVEKHLSILEKSVAG